MHLAYSNDLIAKWLSYSAVDFAGKSYNNIFKSAFSLGHLSAIIALEFASVDAQIVK